MDTDSIAQIIFLIILLGLSAFFSSAETALTTANRIRIKTLADEGNKSAKTLLKIFEKSDKMLSAILIGNNIVNISASSLATILVQDIFGNWAVSISTGVLTVLVLIFGEITPKTAATIHSDTIALKYSGIIWGLMTILTPVIFIINILSSGFMKLMGIDPNDKKNTFTETELRTIMDVSQSEGVLEENECEIINNVFDFGDAEAKDVMIPRIDMCTLDVNSSYEDLISLFKEYRYTRFPVYENSTDNVIGIINIKDLLLYKPGNQFNLRDYLREPYYTYEYKKLSELMSELRKDSVNMIIVLDEYGAAVGLISVEDILEEIVGEIRDEYDYDEEDDFQTINDNEYVVDGQIKLDDINEKLNLDLKSEDYDSLGGYIIGALDRLPAEGDYIDLPEVKIVVDEMNKNRIEKVRIFCKDLQTDSKS